MDRRLVVGRLVGAAGAVEVEGAWVTDPRALRKAWPVTAGYSFLQAPDGGFPPLQAYDATGRVMWKRDDVTMRVGEGFSAGVETGSITAEPVVERTLQRELQRLRILTFQLGGYSMVNGKTLWKLDGYRVVTAFGDGHAMISEPTDSSSVKGWMLIDTRTGEIAAPDQQWDDPTTFDSQCCGGEEYVRVTRHGGVLVAFSDRFVRIWHPQALAHPLTQLSL